LEGVGEETERKGYGKRKMATGGNESKGGGERRNNVGMG
jgi:hypothetical protein